MCKWVVRRAESAQISFRMARLNHSWRLPPAIEARLGESSYGPQRAIYEAEHLLIILHEPPEAEDRERKSTLFLRMPDGSLHCNGHPRGESKLRALLERYREQWADCERLYETAGSASDLFKLLERLAPLNRSSTNLAAALQSAREACKQDKFLISMRDEGHEVSRSYDLLTADARLALEYRIAKNAEEQALRTDQMTEAQHKLNVLAAFTFPVMALATLLGMNLTHGMEARGPEFFWTVLAAGVGVGFLVKMWVMRGR